MTDRTEHSDSIPSRTQRKREALELQRLGQRLIDLDPGDLVQVPLPVEVTDAVALWKRIPSFEAKRRQLQFIGKLMRRIDIEPIEAALQQIDGHSAQAALRFHQLENWRDRLIEEPQALTEYLSDHPQADRQQLRHQLARIHRAKDEARQKNEARTLFRLLRTFEEADSQGSS